MAAEFDERTWLAWLVKVRIIIITFLLGIGLVIVRLTHTNIEQSLFVSVILLWYTLAVFFVVLYTLIEDRKLQARVQVLTDLAMSTVIIYVSGGIDTSFNFLYPLVIIVASILLPRWWAYLTASLSFIGFGAVLELSYFEVIRSYSITRPDIKSLQAIILINLFAYLAIAYLSSNLSQKLRQVDVELQDKSGALEHLQVRHENIIHSMRGGLITTGLDGRVTLINVPGQKLLERRGQDILGMRVDEIFLDRLPNVDSSSVTCEVRSRTPSGTDKTFGVTVSPLTLPDRTGIGYVYTFDDLTDIRRLEREVRMRDRLSAVGRMAAGIAHEIRNPLSSIAGSVQVLSGISNLNEEQRTLVDIVTRESERLNDIISDFLVYSRDKQMRIAQVDLTALLDDTLTLLKNHPQQQQDASKVEIIRNFNVPRAMALVDGDRMKQVFWNLSENALRAMSKGGKLTVSLAGEDQDWVIKFVDTGTGIEQPQLEKIFEPFQSGFGVGTGLGLAIVYQILHAHGAKIAVHSKPGHGAEFAIRVKKMTKSPEVGDQEIALSSIFSKSAAGGSRG
jgi:two-component system sensor histidine kinase PilS (NtrC family)